MSSAIRVARGEFGRVALLDMDRPLVRHAHPHCHILLKVEGADTQFVVREANVPLTEANAILINAWEPHAYEHQPGQLNTVILALYIAPDWLKLFRPNWAASHAPDFFETPYGEISKEVRGRARDLATVMVHAPDDVALQEDLLRRLMIALIERFTAWQGLPHSIRDLARATPSDYRIRKAVKRLESEPGSVEDMTLLAREVGLSRPHFFRLFEKTMGVSPRVYQNVQRIELAVRVVADGTESMAEISDRLGFSAPAHFSRFFHDHAGSNPTVFRRVARLGRKEFETRG